MKRTKYFKRIILIALALMVVLMFVQQSQASVGDWFKDRVTDLGEGLVLALVTFWQEIALIIFGAIYLLTSAITGVDGSGNAATIGDVVFNRCGLTSANFFDYPIWRADASAFNGPAFSFSSEIAKYYTIVRAFSIAVLLLVLLYIGIRMAISTVASDEAKYKKMFFDWAVSLVLVFVLHFIIVAVFFGNNVLVDVLEKVGAPASTAQGIDMIELAAEAAIPGMGWGSLIAYGALVIGNMVFVLMYIKRVIVLGFLIIIAPLITITYAVDKIGDGRSQALNTWLREFIFTVIIQPFHCIIYIVFYGSIISQVGPTLDLGQTIFVASTAFFMLKAEGIVKKIFGIQPSGIGDAIGTGAMALTMATSLLKRNKGKKVDDSKGSMPDMTKDKGTKTKPEQRGDNANSANGARSGANQQTGNAGAGDQSADSGDSNANDTSVNVGNDSGVDVGEAGEANNAAAAETEERQSRISAALGAAKGLPKAGARKISNIPSNMKKDWKRRGGLPGFVGRQVSGGAAIAGLIAGATVGDFKTAASVATATKGVADSAYEDIRYKSAERQLERNQEAFAGAYEDFARAYREEMAMQGKEVTDKQIRQAAEHIYDGGGIDLENEYQRDFYEKMDQLSTSAEIIGYKNGFSYVKESIKLAQAGVITPNSNYVHKNYGRSSGNGGNNGNS